MILKCKNGGVIKLQFAGNIPSIGLQQIVEAANSGDTEKAEALKNQFQLEQAKRIYADNKGESIKTTTTSPDTGTITQGPDKLYNNAYDRWTSNTAKGQEFKRFVNGPLTFAVENGLAVFTGMGTLNRLANASKIANGLYTASKVAPLWQDLAYAAGTSYFATQGLNGLKQDVWGKRQFNPIQTGFDALMSAPYVSTLVPTYNGMKQALSSGNMWSRALRGEPKSINRVMRKIFPWKAQKALWENSEKMKRSFGQAEFDFEYAKDNIDVLTEAVNRANKSSQPIEPLIFANIESLPERGILKSTGNKFAPSTRTLVFENPITNTTSGVEVSGFEKIPERVYSFNMLQQRPEGYGGYAEWIPFNKYSLGTVRSSESPKSIFEPNVVLQRLVGDYRDYVNAKAAGRAVVGGSVQSVADGLHVSIPNDLELYTTEDRLADVLKEFKVVIENKNSRRIKGKSPFAINGDVDIHVIGGDSVDLEELRSFDRPVSTAIKNRFEALQGQLNSKTAKSYEEITKESKEVAKEAEEMFQKLLTNREFLNGFLLKNNMAGLGTTNSARAKFAGRQMEMGLYQPISKLDATLDNIESQIPGFVRFEKAYPNFDYSNVNGNKEFLRYFNLPETFATNPERMRVLYRQFHSQFSPSTRQFRGANTIKDWLLMARKNAQYNGGSASGAGGNMTLASKTGGMSGLSQITAAQYLTTYHPESILNGSDLIESIKRTRLFDRKMRPDELSKIHHVLLNSKNASGIDVYSAQNYSDILQQIGEIDKYNPEINEDIRKISEILDVPRMTGVRYSGSGSEGSTYVGNLSGQPISEQFHYNKPFEFGRSFVDELNPERTGSISTDITDISQIPDLEKLGLSSTEIKHVKEAIRQWKLFSSGDPELKKQGFRMIESVPQAEAEIKRLQNIKRPARSDYEVWEAYKNVDSKLTPWRTAKYNVLPVATPLTILGGVFGIPIALATSGDNDWKLYDKKFFELFKNSKYYDEYERLQQAYSEEGNKYKASNYSKDFDITVMLKYEKRMHDLIMKYYNENKEALKPSIKEIKRENKEERKEIRREISEKRKEEKAKKKEEKRKQK